MTLESPDVQLVRARSDVLAIQPVARALPKRLPRRRDPFSFAAEEAQVGTPGLRVFKASVYGLPSLLASGVDVEDLVRRCDLPVNARPVVNAAVTRDRGLNERSRT